MTEDPLFSAREKLRWARARIDQFDREFRAIVKPGGGDDRPFGIQYALGRRGRLWMIQATFIAEHELPVDLSLTAADAVHNGRVALDHVVAALKAELGGDPGEGGFPVCRTEQQWTERTGGRRNPLAGLPDEAVAMINTFQPYEGPHGDADPLRVLNRLDNDDKHQRLHLAFVYPQAATGLDLIQVRQPQRVSRRINRWSRGEPLRHGTPIADYPLIGDGQHWQRIVSVIEEQEIGCTVGDIQAQSTSFVAMFDRVEQVIDAAQQLLDRGPEPASP